MIPTRKLHKNFKTHTRKMLSTTVYDKMKYDSKKYLSVHEEGNSFLENGAPAQLLTLEGAVALAEKKRMYS